MPAPDSSSTSIRLQIDDGVARLTLGRPPLNVLDVETLRQFNQALARCEGSDARVVVIRSAIPRAFSAGVEIADHAADRLESMLAEIRENVQRLLALPAITIAAIRGATLGGGAEIALLCDLLVAADDVTLRFPEIGLAAFPPIGAALLPRRWPGAAMRLLLGDTLDAGQAERLGLVAAVVPAVDLDDLADRFAAKIASYSAVALRALIGATRARLGAGLMQEIDSSIEIYRQRVGPSHDAEEGINAFIEKREPTWSHH